MSNINHNSQLNILKGILEYINRVDHSKLIFTTAAWNLSFCEASQEIQDIATKLAMDNALRCMRSASDLEDPHEVWQKISHICGQAAQHYRHHYKTSEIGEGFHCVGWQLLIWYAIFKEVQGRNWYAADVFERVGKKEKALRLRALPEDAAQDADGLYNETFEEDMPKFMQATRDFLNETKAFPLMDQSTREGLIKELETKIQAEIESMQ